MKKVNFSNTEQALKHLTNKELMRSQFLFRLLQYGWLGLFLSKTASLALKLHLPVKWFIKQTIYKQFVGGETKEEYKPVINKLHQHNVYTILDYSVEGQEDKAHFTQTKIALLDLLDQAKENTAIPITCLKVSGLASNKLLEKVSSNKDLNQQDKQDWNDLITRLDEIFSKAKSIDKPVYIDAEESWIQLAIDNLCEYFMKKYNRDQVIVFTTVQMYRKDRLSYLQSVHQKAQKDAWLLGVKVVRGAYIEKEAIRAKEFNYPNPIHNSKQHTDADYNLAVTYCIENISSISICLGSHNEQSASLAIKLMEELGIEKNHKHVWFSQLFGMSDHISFNLAHHGYNVSKYLPFGPVFHTIPYLSRRASENSAIAGQMSKELSFISAEIKRRKNG